jgi:SprT protein
MTVENLLSLLGRHVPKAAVSYCFALWEQSPFHLKISKSRLTKVGDFSCSGLHATPRITLNSDLNPYLFLITYLHEVAHLQVYNRHQRKAEPHGKEWKLVFQKLMAPLLTTEIFPEPVLGVLEKHMENPKASSFADASLTKALRLFDARASEIITVNELPEGSLFIIRGKHFKKGKLRRTRFLCHEVKTKKQYLVPAEATVEKVQLGLAF